MIETLHLFPKLDQKLIEVLKSLSSEDWHRSTLAPQWQVKDIASHMLDGTLRGISMSRDSYFGEQPDEINGYQDLVSFINRLNADWVKACKRLSPEVLIHLLEICSPLYTAHLKELDLQGEALFSVAWAGEDSSKAWFHIAREYTEKFHHQQQIRLAVGKDAELLEESLYLPYLETSMRALPHHYKDTDAPEGTVLKFGVGDISKNWFLSREMNTWKLSPNSTHWKTEVIIDKEIAWQLFSKGISKDEIGDRVQINGQSELGEKFLDILAVIA